MVGDVRDSDIKYLGALVLEPDPVSTAPEIADKADVSQQAANSKLQNLQDRGLVDSKKVGGAARVWWITMEGKRAYSEVEG
jgi:predicted ArsR family transcriptional regulator